MAEGFSKTAAGQEAAVDQLATALENLAAIKTNTETIITYNENTVRLYLPFLSLPSVSLRPFYYLPSCCIAPYTNTHLI